MAGAGVCKHEIVAGLTEPWQEGQGKVNTSSNAKNKQQLRFSERAVCQRVVSSPLASDPLVAGQGTYQNADSRAHPH